MADVSPNNSFKGWNVLDWLKGNKEAAKLFLVALFGLWVPADPAIKVLSAAVLKLLLDSIDFYTSKVALN